MTPPSTATPPVNWPLLGGLRFVLALVVVLGHSAVLVPWNGGALGGWAGGFAAVIAFLVISGYSIAHSASLHSVWRFYARRAQRILPAYWAALLFAMVPFVAYGVMLDAPVGPAMEQPTWPEFMASVLALPSVLGPPQVNFTPSWSLGCEVALYLCAPLLVFAKKKTLLALAAISIFMYLQGLGPDGLRKPMVVAWPFLIGWLLYTYPNRNWIRMVGVAAPGAIWAASPVWPAPGGALLVLVSCALIAYNRQIKTPQYMTGLANYLGDLSYPLYLIHMPMFYLIWFSTNAQFAPWVYIGSAMAASMLIHHAIERPFREYAKWRAARSNRGAAQNHHVPNRVIPASAE